MVFTEPSPGGGGRDLAGGFAFCFVCIKAEHIIYLHWPGFEFLQYVWGPEAGGTAHLQSQGEGEAANPHRPVPQGFEPWTFGWRVTAAAWRRGMTSDVRGVFTGSGPRFEFESRSHRAPFPYYETRVQLGSARTARLFYTF